jgi:hypothetical protein
MTRRVSRLGNISVNGDVVFVGSALKRQLVGLKHLTGLRWQLHFFDVDLGTIEIAAINDALASDEAAKAIDVVNLQVERAQRRADHGLKRTRPMKRRA